MIKLSERICRIGPSPTLAITAKAKEMQAQGVKVISLAAGEPDFDTPQYIKDAAVKALKDGFTKYTPASGMGELKEAIIEKFKKDNKIEYNAKEIIVSCGAKHALFNIMQVLCDQGDEVIIPAPYWVTYPEQVKLAGGNPVILPTLEERKFKLSADLLRRVINEHTRILILNSPSNPTGTVYTEGELEELKEVCLENKLWVISDEIYEKIIYDGVKHCGIASMGKDIKDKTLVVNGLSKTYAMTGWRIGYAAGPREIIQAMSNLQSQSTSNPTSFAQKAAVAALSDSQGEKAIAGMADNFRHRRDFLVKELNKWKKVHFLVPQGSFYLFLDISEYFGTSYQGPAINSSAQLSQYLLEKAQVAVIPGSAFGDDQYIRISFANSLENIEEALDRIKKFLRLLS